jgi:hypothetical protein
MVTVSRSMKPIRAIVGNLNRVSALGETLAQVLGGFGLIFDDQNFQVRPRLKITVL